MQPHYTDQMLQAMLQDLLLSSSTAEVKGNRDWRNKDTEGQGPGDTGQERAIHQEAWGQSLKLVLTGRNTALMGSTHVGGAI